MDQLIYSPTFLCGFGADTENYKLPSHHRRTKHTLSEDDGMEIGPGGWPVPKAHKSKSALKDIAVVKEESSEDEEDDEESEAEEVEQAEDGSDGESDGKQSGGEEEQSEDSGDDSEPVEHHHHESHRHCAGDDASASTLHVDTRYLRADNGKQSSYADVPFSQLQTQDSNEDGEDDEHEDLIDPNIVFPGVEHTNQQVPIEFENPGLNIDDMEFNADSSPIISYQPDQVLSDECIVILGSEEDETRARGETTIVVESVCVDPPVCDQQAIVVAEFEDNQSCAAQERASSAEELAKYYRDEVLAVW